MKEFSHRVCAMRCALWFIDNDPDTDISELEQDSRIERYLSRHAHFCYDGRLFKPEHLRLMTLDRFRDLIREMGKRHATNAHTKDGIKHLWRVKSKGLSPEFLSKLEYDMETFTEADLPGPPDLTMGLVKSVFTKASDSETTDSNGSFQAERKADLRSHPNDARKFNGSKHMPIRRSQLIVVLDVEQSFANRSEKYLAHDTRLRALLLLIQQYGLTCYDQKTGTIIELEPSRLIKSLSNAFAGSERGTMAKLWDGRCSQAQNALKSSKEEVEQYEMANNLPTYDSIPFVHSSEDVELQLSRVERCGSHYEAGMEERSRTGGSAKHDEAPLSPIIRILDAARLTQPEKTLFSSSFSILVVIEDIDRSKDDQDRADYKYGSPERRMKALRMIIQQFSLQRWDKAEKAFVEMTEDKLQTMLKGFFYRCQAEKKQATPVNGTKTTPAILLWTQGSTVFEGVDMERLRENSQLLKEGLGADKGLLPIETTPSAEDASESSGEVAGGHRSSFLRERDITSETSEKSPSKLVRKRKAKEASLHSRSASPASRHERDLDFVPQDSPSPMAFQRKGETVSMPFLALSPMASPSGHSRRDSSRQRQSVATAESNRDQLVDGSSVGDTDPSMVAPTRMKSMSQEIDLRRLCTNIAGISSNIQHAVTSVFSNLRLDIMLPSPLPTASSEHLVALLSRCWGSDWRMTCHKMISSRVCSAINVLKALMTAFVFENIFAEDVSWQTDIFRSFALPMPSHQEITDVIFDLASMDPEKLQDTQRRARVFIARSILRSELPVLHHHASRLAENFMLLIHGHLSTLSSLAALYDPQSVPPSTIALEEELRDLLARIVEEASALKLNLTHSNCNHRFFWPTPGTSFDPAEMESVHALQRNQGDQMVGFTVFPGLSVQIGGHVHLVRPAQTFTTMRDVWSDGASGRAGSSALN